MTAFDFINKDIPSNHLKAGWKVEAANGLIILRYTILNFDWLSLEFLGEEGWDLFLKSTSYANMKAKLAKAKSRYPRLYLEAQSISGLKLLAAEANIKADIGKLVAKAISKKSKKIQQDHQAKLQLSCSC